MWLFLSAAMLFIALFLYIRTARILKSMNRMLDAALEGNFHETDYRETPLSALETRMAQYLKAGQISSERIAQERDRLHTLIADLSHQIKTPLANIRLHTELLYESALCREAYEDVRVVSSETEKLSFLIHSLLKLSRLENGLIAPEPVRTEIGTLLSQLSDTYASNASAKGLQFTVRPLSEPLFACFDLKWTREACGNLLDNAVKYTHQGGITVRATAYELFVRIDFADTGVGISDDELPKIFARFYRSASAREQEGVGIGLALTREILAAQNGYIKAASTPGSGSVFSVFLPKA